MAKSSFNKLVEEAMKEVHKNIPSTVERANVSGEQEEKMLEAIAFSKAKKAASQKK